MNLRKLNIWKSGWTSITLYFWLTLVEVNWWQGEECKIVSFVLRGGGSCCCCYKSYFIIIVFLIFSYKNNTFFYRTTTWSVILPFLSSKQFRQTRQARSERNGWLKRKWRRLETNTSTGKPDFFCHASRLARSHPRACPALTAACLKNVIDDAYPVGNLKSSSILCLNIIFHFISQVSHERPYLPQWVCERFGDNRWQVI